MMQTTVLEGSKFTLVKRDSLRSILTHSFNFIGTISIPNALPFKQLNLMLSKGDVHFNPVCLHATVVSLHSRPHRQRGPAPRGQRPLQQ